MSGIERPDVTLYLQGRGKGRVCGISAEKGLCGKHGKTRKTRHDETHEPSQTPLRNQRKSINVDRPAVSFRRQDFHYQRWAPVVFQPKVLEDHGIRPPEQPAEMKLEGDLQSAEPIARTTSKV